MFQQQPHAREQRRHAHQFDQVANRKIGQNGDEAQQQTNRNCIFPIAQQFGYSVSEIDGEQLICSVNDA